MSKIRCNFGMAFWLCCATWTASISAQQSDTPQTGDSSANETVSEVLDYGETIVVFQSRHQFIQHSRDVLNDLGLFSDTGFRLDDLFQFKQKGEFNGDRPVVFYFDDFEPSAVQLPIQSMDAVQARAVDGTLTGQAGQRPFKINENGFQFALYSYADYDLGVILGNRFVTSDDKAFIDGISSARPIADDLTKRIQQLVNESGISVITRATAEFHPRLHTRHQHESEKYSEQELRTLQLVDEAYDSAERVALGLTYEQKCLNFSGLISFEENEAIEKLINFDSLDKNFQPTLGLPREQLIASASLRVDALNSTASARVLSKILSSEYGSGSVSKWLDGQMIRTAMQLMADTWHDITSIRMAAYLMDGSLSQGSFCLIGVADARVADTIIPKLQRLSTLVDPSDDADSVAARNAEIERLIGQLDATRYDIRQRATTQLTLAGRAAEPQLVAASNSQNLETASRAKKILADLEKENQLAAKNFAVNDVDFWSNLRPQFSMEAAPSKIGGCETHLIRIYPDPSKTPLEVENATNVIKAMYGEGWNKVHLVRVDDQFVFMFGSDVDRLGQAVQHVKKGFDPIGQSAVIRNQPVRSADLQIHFSLAQLNNLSDADRRQNQVEVKDEHLSTVTVTLGRTDWEARFHIPIAEVKVLISSPFLFPF